MATVPALPPQARELLEAIRAVVLEDSDPANASPLAWLAAAKPNIVHPTLGVVPFEPRSYQQDVLSDWRERARLIVKSRQLGFSQTFAAEAYWKCRYRPPRSILVVSRNEDSAFEFMRYLRRFCSPEDLLEDTKGQLVFRNGSRVKAESATRSAGRSFAASDAYLDEYAHAPWALEIWQAVRPTVATGGSVTVFSSPKGRSNVFYWLWAGRLGQEEWKRYRYPWDVLWDEEWAKRERAQMTREAFAEEYSADFIESGGAIFSQADIDACWSEEAVTAGCQAGREYVLTADVAGPGEDATVCQVWDVRTKPYTLVHSERWLEGPYERFYQRASDLVREYRCHRAIVDATGLGNPLVEELEDRCRGRVEGFVFTKKSKEEALTALQLLVQHHELTFSDPQLRMEAELYQRDDEGLVTDSLMACAILAWAMANRPGRGRVL